ncbi:MAG TPA: hypothetical protein VMU26_12735 [Candidatus Polarisedimenticolia bacterium]|nr:hypothetical protein [Candidatus Polarisedimenticolia bacterium]
MPKAATAASTSAGPKGGQQFRRKAETRSWAEAEELKRRLEDQLAGRAPSDATNEEVPIDVKHIRQPITSIIY